MTYALSDAALVAEHAQRQHTGSLRAWTKRVEPWARPDSDADNALRRFDHHYDAGLDMAALRVAYAACLAAAVDELRPESSAVR